MSWYNIWLALKEKWNDNLDRFRESVALWIGFFVFLIPTNLFLYSTVGSGNPPMWAIFSLSIVISILLSAILNFIIINNIVRLIKWIKFLNNRGIEIKEKMFNVLKQEDNEKRDDDDATDLLGAMRNRYYASSQSYKQKHRNVKIKGVSN